MSGLGKAFGVGGEKPLKGKPKLVAQSKGGKPAAKDAKAPMVKMKTKKKEKA